MEIRNELRKNLKMISLIMVLLAVYSIVMGVISFITAIIQIQPDVAGLVVASIGFAIALLVAAGFQLWAGIAGLRAIKKKGSTKICSVLSIIVLSIAVVSISPMLFSGELMSPTNFITGLTGILVPSLFLDAVYKFNLVNK